MPRRSPSPRRRPPADAPFADDAFAAKLKQSAKAQNDALAGVGTFTQQHQAKDVVGGLRLAGGKGALVFAVMTRKDTLLNRTQGTITPSPQFQALTGLTSIKAEAVQDSLELVLFVVPDSGPGAGRRRRGAPRLGLRYLTHRRPPAHRRE